MSLVDKLLLVNSPQKIQQMEKVKKHKHVVFAEAPTIIHFDKKKSPRPPLVEEKVDEEPPKIKETKTKFRSMALNPVSLPVEEKVEVVQEEVKEVVEESSSSSEEVEYVKESVDGVCDFDFCQERTFMRCDYDMNDIIDPRGKRC